MITKLGVLSGDILTLFDEVKGPVCIREIEVYLGESKEDVLMSLGWLVREGFIDIEWLKGEKLFKLKDTAVIVSESLSSA